jgi:hypothetical protein
LIPPKNETEGFNNFEKINIKENKKTKKLDFTAE